MKKILSLLSLLVMTLTAFATDYTGHRTVTYGSNEPTESDNAVVSIVDNGDGTYNVSFVDVINVDGPYRAIMVRTHSAIWLVLQRMV